jgi:hypothetical protein
MMREERPGRNSNMLLYVKNSTTANAGPNGIGAGGFADEASSQGSQAAHFAARSFVGKASSG